MTGDHLVLIDDGDQIPVATENEPVRFVFISGQMIREPVAWYGPIVMNTEEELRITFEEFQNGTLVERGKRCYLSDRRKASHLVCSNASSLVTASL